MDTKIFLDSLQMLSVAMPPSPPDTVDDLGLQGCLYLWALLTSQERRLLVAPTRRLTLTAMNVLREQGIIEVPWPEARWSATPAAEETPLEGLQWRQLWTVYEPAHLSTALEDYLQAVGKGDFEMAVRLRLWIEIGAAEVERFFEQQLVKHHFPSDWAQDMAFAYRENNLCLSLAQWRYCAWAAVRRGASLAMQQGIPGEHQREAIYRELRHRAAIVATGAWPNCALPPYHPTPESALARGFTKFLSKLGMTYWIGRPSIEAMLAVDP